MSGAPGDWRDDAPRAAALETDGELLDGAPLDDELALLADLDGGGVPPGLEGRLVAALVRQEAERAADPWRSLSRGQRRGLVAYWLGTALASALLLVAARGVAVPAPAALLLATVCALAAIPLATLLPLVTSALVSRRAAASGPGAPS